MNTKKEQQLAHALSEGQPLIEWISQYTRYIVWGIVLLTTLFFFVYRMNASSKQEAERDYLIAEKEFAVFKQGEDTDKKAAFEKLQAILNKHPQLQAKYDGEIAQILIAQDQVEAALPFAQRTLKRTAGENNPVFTAYAQTSLLIAEKKYQEALTRSLELQQTLKQTPGNAYDTLFAFNLLRIASLQQALGLKEEELNTWKEWQTFAKEHDPALIAKLGATLTEGEIQITQYAEARKPALTQK